MLSLNMASILDYLCSLTRFWSFPVGAHDSFCRFLKCVKFMVETRQSGSLKVRPYHNNRKSNQLRFFWKKESEREYTMVFLSQHEIENIQLF